jgi:MscS family membrane protein
MALGQAAEHPLKPPDRSSPRALLRTFLDGCDAVGTFVVADYMNAPSRAKSHQLRLLSQTPIQCLDLSELPPAAHFKGGAAAAMALYETLNRVQLPTWDEIPGANELGPPGGTNVARWVIPNTEMAIEGVRGEFRFTAETVARALDFYQRVRRLPYTRPVPLQHLEAIAANGGGWMVPHAWTEALPSWLRKPWANQAVWKWVALGFVLVGFGWLTRLALRASRGVSGRHPFLEALAQLAFPTFILVTTPMVAYLALVQINLTVAVGTTVELVTTAISFLAGAWFSWRAAPVVAEAIIASPHIGPQSIDAHLIRICSRLLGIVAGAILLAMGAERLGLPLYGIIAGLGVGGLAIALAAQSTIENLIGGLSLFADKPIRVGDFCKYGSDLGTVEAIGIRSTRIRGVDRTVTTVPNAVLSKMPVVNFAVRDRMLLSAVLGLRYETKPEQLRHVLAKLRELLLAHPKVTPEPSRVRLVGFGDFSLNLEITAYIATSDWNEFLEIREDLYLRMIEVITESGTGLAFPSQTLYFARDPGLDPDKSTAAIAEVGQWRADHKLPFPNFDIEFRKTHRDTLEYPPAGSAVGKSEPQD